MINPKIIKSRVITPGIHQALSQCVNSSEYPFEVIGMLCNGLKINIMLILVL
jgi:hypothetical protein